MTESRRNTEPVRSLERRLGEKLKRCRERKGYSQIDVGAAVGVSQSQVGRYERGERPIPVLYLVLVADLFQKPITYFLDDVDVLGANSSELETGRYELLMRVKDLLHEQDDQTLAVLAKLMARD